MVYEDKQPIGCACYGRGRDEDHGTWGEIVSIYLAPDWMGQGYGGQLLEETLNKLREQGFQLLLFVDAPGESARRPLLCPPWLQGYFRHGCL